MSFKYLSYTINSLDDVKALAASKEADGSPFNLNRVDDNGYTFLHKAAQSGKLNILKYLVELKDSNGQPRITNLNQVDNYGWTPFHEAARSGNLDAVKYLVELKDSNGQPRITNLNQADRDGKTPLHCAAGTGNLDMAKYLVELKDSNDQPLFNLNQANDYGRTPMHEAAASDCLDMVKYLVELKNSNGQPRITNLNQADNRGETPLHYAARLQLHSTIDSLLSLKDAQGYLRVDINKHNILQFYAANPEMARTIREYGHFEMPSTQPEAALQAADTHGQNVHAWYDIACGEINLKALKTRYTALDMKAPHAEGFTAFKTYVNAQITALKNNRNYNETQNDNNSNSNNNHRNDLSFALIPAEFKASCRVNENVPISAAEKLTDRLEYFEELPTPSDWHSYAEEQPDGSDTKTIQTTFKNYADFKDIIGLMWNVLNNPGFVREILPPNADDERVASHITHLQQSFIHALLLADNCAKGRTSKLFHRVLEGVHPSFTTRSVIIEAFNTERRKYQNTQMLNEDVHALQPAITEDLLRQAYLAKDKYPQQFEDLVQYLSNPRFMNLMDKEDASYDQYFGVRQHIIGHAKRYLHEHFPKGYPRQKPIEADYRTLEQQYIPGLFYKQLNQLLLAKPIAYSSVINHFFEIIHDAIQSHQPLPEITPEIRRALDSNMLQGDDESWAVQYERQRKHLHKMTLNRNIFNIWNYFTEKELQYTLLKIATKSSHEKLELFFDAKEFTDEFDAMTISSGPSYLPLHTMTSRKRSHDEDNNNNNNNNVTAHAEKKQKFYRSAPGSAGVNRQQ